MQSASMEIFGSCMDVVLGTLLCMSLLELKCDQMDPDVPSDLNRSV